MTEQQQPMTQCEEHVLFQCNVAVMCVYNILHFMPSLYRRVSIIIVLMYVAQLNWKMLF